MSLNNFFIIFSIVSCPGLILHIYPFVRIRQDPPGEQPIPEGGAGFIVIATPVKFDHIMPANDFIDRAKFSDSPLNLPVEPFNSSIGLGGRFTRTTMCSQDSQGNL
jgi:hypothetical protein